MEIDKSERVIKWFEKDRFDKALCVLGFIYDLVILIFYASSAYYWQLEAI